MHIQKSYKEDKWEGRRCVQRLQIDRKNSHSCSGTFIFLVSDSVLNATPVTNVFLSYTLLYFTLFLFL